MHAYMDQTEVLFGETTNVCDLVLRICYPTTEVDVNTESVQGTLSTKDDKKPRLGLAPMYAFPTLHPILRHPPVQRFYVTHIGRPTEKYKALASSLVMML